MLKNLPILVLFIVAFGITPSMIFAQNIPSNRGVPNINSYNTTPKTIVPDTNSQITTANTATQEMNTAKQQMLGKIQQERAVFKQKLAAIKDIRKQTIVKNIDLRITAINSTRTAEMSRRLDRLTLILERISSKEAALKTEGKNTTMLQEDITLANNAITTAKTSVAAQLINEYVITITSTTALKADVMTSILQFKTDIETVYQKVVVAQNAVITAFKEANKLMGNTIPIATQTP